MAGEASTSVLPRATPVLGATGSWVLVGREYQRVKGRILLIVLLVLLVAALGGLAYLGLNPPNPTPKQVEKTLPNDKFQAH